MKIILVRKEDEKISDADIAPDRYTLDEISKMVEEWNLKSDLKYSYYEISDELGEIFSFLVNDRKTDKSRLLDAVNELKGDVNSLVSAVDDTYDYIAEKLKEEK